jgi:serine/threonine-protein kinase HipA
MISKRSNECFVYITLPGAREAVTAGRFVLEQTPDGVPIGRFVYGRSYLDNPNAVEIDPVELKLSTQTYETVRLNGVFGAIRDAGPDYWGRRVIEKHAGIPKLGELDYLLESPDDRAGALGSAHATHFRQYRSAVVAFTKGILGLAGMARRKFFPQS